MDRRLIAAIAGGIIIVIGLVVWLSGGEDDPKKQIMAVIERTTLAAEERNLGGVMEAVSEGFVGPYAMKKDELRRFIFARLYRGEWRRIFVVGTEITLEDDTHAKVKTGAVLVRGEGIDKLEDFTKETKADSLRFELDFVKEDDDWRVVKSTYRRSTPDELLEDLLP